MIMIISLYGIDCHGWLDHCETSWTCNTYHHYLVYMSHPTPSCPAKPPDYSAPMEPGFCEYNVTVGECLYTTGNIIYNIFIITIYDLNVDLLFMPQSVKFYLLQSLRIKLRLSDMQMIINYNGNSNCCCL